MSSSVGPLVAGVDSSTQSCKVVVRDGVTGELVRQGRAMHPPGTEIDPELWWVALQQAIEQAGGLDDVAAVSIGAQQHAMVCLDSDGHVVRPALLWNDTRSGAAAASLVAELGPNAWATSTGSVPVASFTVTKLRWLAEHEPANAQRTALVCLPHDYLSWRLSGSTDIAEVRTDRSDASGTGYFDSVTNRYRLDLIEAAFGRIVGVPPVSSPWAGIPTEKGRWPGLVLGPGGGDNACAAIGVQAGSDVVVSLGTSGTAFAHSDAAVHDGSGIVAGFADLTGRYLPLVCTMNAAQVLQTTARLLQVDLDGLSRLALSAPPGAEGVVVLPYLDGERTPNLPDATGSILGLTLSNATAANIARAAVEGMLCGLAIGLDALAAHGVAIARLRLIGGLAQSGAVCQIAPTIFGVDVSRPATAEYVAEGAAAQALAALTGAHGLPSLQQLPCQTLRAQPQPHVRRRFSEAASKYLDR